MKLVVIREGSDKIAMAAVVEGAPAAVFVQMNFWKGSGWNVTADLFCQRELADKLGELLKLFPVSEGTQWRRWPDRYEDDPSHFFRALRTKIYSPHCHRSAEDELVLQDRKTLEPQMEAVIAALVKQFEGIPLGVAEAVEVASAA